MSHERCHGCNEEIECNAFLDRRGRLVPALGPDGFRHRCPMPPPLYPDERLGLTTAGGLVERDAVRD